MSSSQKVYIYMQAVSWIINALLFLQGNTTQFMTVHTEVELWLQYRNTTEGQIRMGKEKAKNP